MEKQLAQLHLLISLRDDIDTGDYKYLYNRIMNEIRQSDAGNAYVTKNDKIMEQFLIR